MFTETETIINDTLNYWKCYDKGNVYQYTFYLCALLVCRNFHLFSTTYSNQLIHRISWPEMKIFICPSKPINWWILPMKYCSNLISLILNWNCGKKARFVSQIFLSHIAPNSLCLTEEMWILSDFLGFLSFCIRTTSDSRNEKIGKDFPLGIK